MLKKFGHPTVSQRFPHRVQAFWSFAEIFVTRMRSCCGNQSGVLRHVVERTLVKRRSAIPTPTPLPEHRRPTPCIRTPSRWGPFPRRALEDTHGSLRTTVRRRRGGSLAVPRTCCRRRASRSTRTECHRCRAFLGVQRSDGATEGRLERWPGVCQRHQGLKAGW